MLYNPNLPLQENTLFHYDWRIEALLNKYPHRDDTHINIYGTYSEYEDESRFWIKQHDLWVFNARLIVWAAQIELWQGFNADGETVHILPHDIKSLIIISNKQPQRLERTN